MKTSYTLINIYRHSDLLSASSSTLYSCNRLLLTELKFPLLTLSIIFSDNQLAITITHHPEFHTHTKHIDIALHFLWDHVNKGTLNMFYIKTNYNIANIITKVLTWPIHQNFTYKSGIVPVKGECWDSDWHILACTSILYIYSLLTISYLATVFFYDLKQ